MSHQGDEPRQSLGFGGRIIWTAFTVVLVAAAILVGVEAIAGMPPR